MYVKKSTKGISRGPYRRTKNRFDLIVAKAFCDRIRELNVTQRSLLATGNGEISQPTMTRILNGGGGANINTVAALADLLGLEIIIRKKQTDDESEN